MTSPIEIVAAAAVKIPPSLSLYSDWKFCSACGSSPSTATTEEPKTPSSSPLSATNINDSNENNGNDTNIKKKKAKSKRLSTCTRCKTAAYSSVDCQKADWKRGHKQDCKILSSAIQPLLEIAESWKEFQSNNHLGKDKITNTTKNYIPWWAVPRLDPKGASECNRVWKANEKRWNQKKEYLQAMDGFQQSLEPIMVLWNIRSIASAQVSMESMSLQEKDDKNSDENGKNSDSTTGIDYNLIKYGISLSKRLLFCAYCEADGNKISDARNRLARCISILLECISWLHNISSKEQNGQSLALSTIITSLLNDAWMELLLSYEEETGIVRNLVRHVAQLAVSSSCHQRLYECVWAHPLQRPGYIARCLTTKERSPPFVPPHQHPKWCAKLEAHWKEIAQELNGLMMVNNGARSSSYYKSSTSHCWSEVGSGQRGSGSDDHKVVSAGGRWTECVLFGTGAQPNHVAPITKGILRDCVPDAALSLARDGGGEVIFSKLAPRTKIKAHCGPTNLRWTAHLGLVVPQNSEKCRIKIADEWHCWEEGKMLVFDDSYEHEIANDTNETRIVLLLRVWHPSLSYTQRDTELRAALEHKTAAVEKRYHAPKV